VDQVPRHPTQIYESLSYLLVFLISYYIYLKKPKSPRGLLLGTVFVGLFTARIIWEFFKENQEPFEAGMPLNMGQLLSIPFILCGLFLIVRALREKPAPEPTGKPKRSNKKQN
jgi:prolipoprotein diacylglyceryltransferase